MNFEIIAAYNTRQITNQRKAKFNFTLLKGLKTNYFTCIFSRLDDTQQMCNFGMKPW